MCYESVISCVTRCYGIWAAPALQRVSRYALDSFEPTAAGFSCSSLLKTLTWNCPSAVSHYYRQGELLHKALLSTAALRCLCCVLLFCALGVRHFAIIRFEVSGLSVILALPSSSI
jgi:hypothetical protein